MSSKTDDFYRKNRIFAVCFYLFYNRVYNIANNKKQRKI